jgi:hypothetical protein
MMGERVSDDNRVSGLTLKAVAKGEHDPPTSSSRPRRAPKRPSVTKTKLPERASATLGPASRIDMVSFVFWPIVSKIADPSGRVNPLAGGRISSAARVPHATAHGKRRERTQHFPSFGRERGTQEVSPMKHRSLPPAATPFDASTNLEARRKADTGVTWPRSDTLFGALDAAGNLVRQ